MGPAFLVIGIPALIVASMFSPKGKSSELRMFVGMLTTMLLSPASVVYVWYQYNFIAGIVAGIVVFYIGHKLAAP